MSIPNPSWIFNARAFAQATNGYPADATFTRATSAYRRRASGLLESVSSGVLRIEADPLIGDMSCARFEEARTNLHPRSGLVTTAYNAGNATQTDSVTTGPDGVASSAGSIIENSSAAPSHGQSSSSGMTITANTTYTVSRFFKAAGRTKGRLDLSNGASSAGMYVLFDLAAETATGGTYNGSSTVSSVGIRKYPNGWYRVWCTGIVDNSSTSALLVTYLRDSSGNTSYTGDGVSGLYAWGSQVELGSSPTSYIATAASSATRNADNLVWPTTALPDFNTTEGSMFVIFAPDAASVQTGIMRLYGAGGSITIYRNSSNGVLLDVNDGSPRGNGTGTVSASAGAFITAVASWKVGSAYISTNGGTPASFSPAALPATLTSLELGGGTLGTGPLNGVIKAAGYWPKWMAANDVQRAALAA